VKLLFCVCVCVCVEQIFVLVGRRRVAAAKRRNVRKHSDLTLDVPPFTGGFVRVSQQLVQLLSHADDAVCHALDFGLPLLVQTFVAQDRVRDAGAVDGGVGVHGADDDLQLALYAGPFIGICADEGEGSDTLAVEAHVLGERLGEGDLMSLLDEVTDGEGVAGGVAGGKSLVCHVEEGEEVLGFDDLGYLFPLRGCGVYARGIVCACVEEDDRAFRSVLHLSSSSV
jgi:hypothetical protein